MTGSLNVDGFNAAARPIQKCKAPPPVSVRLTWDEYERLRHDAGALSMAAHIRLTLFGESEVSRHRKPYTRKQTSPSSELTMIGQMLGRLGESGIAANLADLAMAARIGALPVSPEMEAEIQDACDTLRDMRARLIAALGVGS